MRTYASGETGSGVGSGAGAGGGAWVEVDGVMSGDSGIIAHAIM